MHSSELQILLTGIAADRLALLKRHEAGARVVAHYDFNNTYQYVIAREETHLAWLRNGLAEMSAPLPPAGADLAVPDTGKPGKGTRADPSVFRSVLEDDARHLAAFVTRWRQKIDEMAHARHRTMLRVVLGESQEHQRLFEQASAGVEDVLGRRTGGSRIGGVLPTRWVE